MLTWIVPIRLFRRSLTAKILLALTVVILVGIGSVAVLANLRMTAAFEHYVKTGRPDASGRLVDVVTTVYQETHSLAAVGTALSSIPLPPDQRVLLANPSGKIVIDTSQGWIGRSVTSLVLPPGDLVTENGQTVGTVYLVDTGDSGESAAVLSLFDRSPAGLTSDDQAFLAQVDESLFLAAIGAMVVALVLGFLLAQQVVRPLRSLTRAAQRVPHGHLDERIQVNGDDEVAQLADAFNEMAESLQRTEAARRQMVADIAHELRTPLTVIGGTVQAMRDGVLPADEASLDAIQEEVVSLTRLVADLRDLSLGDVGQLAIRQEAVDLLAIVESVASAFAAEAAARGITLTVDRTDEIPWILGDETRLRQCVRNLVDNALRHTPSGGTIVIALSAPRNSATIAVIDSGEGILAEHLPHLFDRFFRADQSRNRRSGGSGLGLAIVQQIVHAHGGEVFATSPGPGRGATFTLRLPVSAGTTNGHLAEVLP